MAKVMENPMPRGGYRPGAGRPKGSPTIRVPELAAEGEADPLAYLLAVMNDPAADPARRDRAAIAALPYVHARADAGGKKAAALAAASDAESGTEWEWLLR
ncbi:hypothetical protein [Roseicella aquatilis]|uniref:DUF5681 domain-containing protein n=1 Tax=Roseicella aquatilis TaxID=2527868 RepID=A0A4R4DKE6_9PROT|nr:hypothetical protein [Roseicella aquatilis]TCZ61270.1 hypothetical protein EXY23_12030 [Roseicella aquatilis]